jgi:hypothetical protein
VRGPRTGATAVVGPHFFPRVSCAGRVMTTTVVAEAGERRGVGGRAGGPEGQGRA